MLVRAAGQLRAFGTGARAVMLLLGGISAPVLAIGAVLAVVAYTVWKYWAPIKAFFIGFAHGLSDVLGPAFAAEDVFKSTALTPATAATIRALADLAPSTIALMHGPSFNGDCAEQL
jgi:hypothetical protein